MKISVKLIVCYLIAVILIILAVNFWGTGRYEDRIRSEFRERYSNVAEGIADNTVSAYYYNADVSHVRGELQRIARIVKARLLLVNSAGTVIIDTDNELDMKSIEEEIMDPLVLGREFSEDIRIREEGEAVAVASAPVMSNYKTAGYVCVIVPMSQLISALNKNMDILNVSIIMICGVFLLMYIVIFLFTVFPVKKIRKAAIEYGKGNYEHKIKIKGHDEFRELGDTINYMVGELQNTEEKQRKFIANISHDFRSPLTSIKGYAEAIKDGTIPFESKDKYLDIILFEAERLHKLTSNILDLNSMDSGAVKLNIKSFNINRVIKRIADSFEGICRQKKLTIRLQFEEADMFVDADQGKIEQVIYNLTDNAIKFSESGSEILIGAEIKGSKTLIRVKDTGCGIPKDSIKKIWDRFYKSDSSRGKDKKGTGLGLSIVREIITAHDENINVISTEGVGTEFSFTLPVS